MDHTPFYIINQRNTDTPNHHHKLIISRDDVDSSFPTIYGYLYYIFMILALSIPWMIVSFISFCNPLRFWKGSLNRKHCILFSLATIMSSIAFIFGMIMSITYDCSNQLYNFIKQLIDQDKNSVYPSLNGDDFVTWPGATFIFLWINWMMCIVFAFYFIKHNKNKDETKMLLLQTPNKSEIHKMVESNDDKKFERP